MRRAMLSRVLMIMIFLATGCGPGYATSKPLHQLSAIEAVDLLCSRQITAVKLVKALLKRIKAYKCINAVAELIPEKVLAEAAAIDAKAARGEDVKPLCGLPIAVKDNIDVKGYHTVAGSPGLKGFKPAASCPLIDKIYKANGVVLAKVRMHELAFAYTSINPHFGPVLNPYNPIRHVGGSSGGSGAIVGSYGAPIALCTDTGGSCRVPSFVNGAVGFRPSTDCWQSSGGVVPMTTTRDTVGVIARSVADVVIIHKILDSCNIVVPPKPALKGLKIGKPADWWGGFDPKVETTLNKALEVITAAGAQIQEFDFSDMTKFYLDNQFSFGIFDYEFQRETSRYIYNHKYDLSYVDFLDKIATPEVKDYMTRISTQPLDSFPSPTQYRRMMSLLPELAAKWKKPFVDGGFDVMILPCSYDVAAPINEAEPGSQTNGKWGYWRWITSPSGAILFDIDPHFRIPSVCLPAGWVNEKGAFVGIGVYSSEPETDGRVLAVAAALEAILPKPPLPPDVPDCSGCTPEVTAVNVEIPADQTSAPEFGDLVGYGYNFGLKGTCKLKRKFSFPLKAPFQAP